MHNRWYYRNSNGRIDVHAIKMSWKNHDAYKNYRHQLKAVTDWYTNYSYYRTNLENTLWVNVEWLNANRKNTQLALRSNLNIVPIDRYSVGHELKERNFSMVPAKNTLPTPVKPRQIMLAA